MSVPVSLIVALAANRVIGRDNTLPWHIAEDLKRFNALTMGRAIIMGRKTFELIGRPLPGRRNIVVSANPGWRVTGADGAGDLEEALSLAATTETQEIFVIGGARLFAEALPLARRMYLTEIKQDYEGDVFFPPFNRGEWREVAHEDKGGDPPYAFVTLERE